LTKKQHLSILLLSIGAVLFQPLILFNVYYVHTYYYIAVSPFFCLIVGILLNEIIKIDRIRKEIVYFFVFGVACIILFMGSGYLIETFESYTVEDSEISLIENLTDNDDRIIIASGDWNPILLYTVNRKGLMLSHFDGYSFDKVYEEVLADNSEEYTMLVGTETEDLYQVICNYPSNIQFICNTDFVSRLYSDESCPVDSVNSSEWNECDGAVDIDNEQIIRFDRNGNRDADFSNIIIEVDGQEYDRMIILFAPDSDYAYLSTKGFSGSLNIICNDDYITMSCVDCTL
jgi:hypothetical protein